MQVTIVALLGAAATIYLRRLIMATRAENQARLDGIAEAQDKAAATQVKAYKEIVGAIQELRDAAAAGEVLDFTRVEAGAGLLAEGAKNLDDLNEDKAEELPEDTTPPVTEPETPPATETPAAEPLVDGATAGDPNTTTS